MQNKSAWRCTLIASLGLNLVGCSPVHTGFGPASGATSMPVLSGASVSSRAGETTPPLVTSNAPTGIVDLYPHDGASVCARPPIGADLTPTDAMRKDGTFDLSSIALSLDGQDITLAATIRETLTSPVSRVSVLYTPGADLTLGEHQAQITYAATGSATVTWNFNVSGIPCK